MTNNLLVYILLAVLLLQSIFHARERKDLYDRIMAKDLKEYNVKSREPPKSRNFVRRGIEKGYDMEGVDEP